MTHGHIVPQCDGFDLSSFVALTAKAVLFSTAHTSSCLLPGDRYQEGTHPKAFHPAMEKTNNLGVEEGKSCKGEKKNWGVQEKKVASRHESMNPISPPFSQVASSDDR